MAAAQIEECKAVFNAAVAKTKGKPLSSFNEAESLFSSGTTDLLAADEGPLVDDDGQRVYKEQLKRAHLVAKPASDLAAQYAASMQALQLGRGNEIEPDDGFDDTQLNTPFLATGKLAACT